MVTRHWLFSTRIIDNRIKCPFLLLLGCLTAAMALELASVQNLRPVVQSPPSSSSSSFLNLYRSAALDKLSMRDAQTLLQSSSGVTIIDLRNADESERGAKERTEGSQWFYRQLVLLDTNNEQHHQQQQQHSLIHIPILQDVDAFWDEAISRMPIQGRLLASLQSTFQSGALDQAAARHMEQGGHVVLNTIMLASCGSAIRKALDAVCAVKSSGTTTMAKTAAVNDNIAHKKDSHGPPLVLFHCQKGKDRTGVVAMLLQHCMGDSKSEIIRAYGHSGALLGEDEDSSNNMAATSSAGLVDWNYFRGSPESAMRDTLLWIQATYGSMDGYLDSIHIRKALPRIHTTTNQ